jgi:hypothetical protein
MEPAPEGALDELLRRFFLVSEPGGDRSFKPFASGVVPVACGALRSPACSTSKGAALLAGFALDFLFAFTGVSGLGTTSDELNMVTSFSVLVGFVRPFFMVERCGLVGGVSDVSTEGQLQGQQLLPRAAGCSAERREGSLRGGGGVSNAARAPCCELGSSWGRAVLVSAAAFHSVRSP